MVERSGTGSGAGNKNREPTGVTDMNLSLLYSELPPSVAPGSSSPDSDSSVYPGEEQHQPDLSSWVRQPRGSRVRCTCPKLSSLRIQDLNVKLHHLICQDPPMACEHGSDMLVVAEPENP
ncbi:hypothetical protein PIB30_106633, partial [Stylosanthes scabra]|nr:hypothetical protein [Stylosanthes scabra]